MTESEGPWVYSCFDVTNWFAWLEVFVNILCKVVCDIKSRIDLGPFLSCHDRTDAYFYLSFDAYKSRHLVKTKI